MRACIALLGIVVLCAFRGDWETGFAAAMHKAKQENKYILLNFSGSDWCGPCIRLKKTIFASSEFVTFADSCLVLVNADFPRQKKNRLPGALQKQNDELAATYNASGSFPYTVLLNAEGKVVRSWDGLPQESSADFVHELRKLVYGTR